MKHINYKTMHRLLFVLLFCRAFAGLAQTDSRLQGRVTDAEGQGLPGATVMVKGTSTGTITDMDGNFILNLESGWETLTISFVGYLSVEYPLNGKTEIAVTLQEDMTALEEVVVVGYGTVKKSDLTGSVAVVGTEQFNKGAINSVQDLMLGKTAGVSITSNSGAPGNTSTIRIRGGSSMSASNDPLIIIDGVPLDNTPIGGTPNILTILNPNDIASITILKDASATAIYGSRAANGVVIIATKRGQQGMKVSYNLTASVYTTPKTVDVYSGDEFRMLINDVYAEQPSITGLLGTANTDWQSEIYKTAFGQDHNLSFSGKVKNLPYRAAIGYNNTDGILRTYNFERTTVSVGLDPKFFNDHLKVQMNVKGMNNNNNFADQGAIGNAVAYDPTQPVYNGNTKWRGYTTWTLGGINGSAINLAPANPVAQLALTDNTSNSKRSIGNIQLDYTMPFLEDLRANLNLGYDISETNGRNNVKDSTQWVYVNDAYGGRINPYHAEHKNQLLDFYLNYSREIGTGKLEAMGGYSYAHFWRGNNDSNTDAAGVTVRPDYDFETEYYLVSFFGRLNYSLSDKYLFTLTLRDDATSRFSPETRWGLFPAAAFAWNIGNEGLLKNSDLISDLKLRVGYGITGQQDVTSNNYPYIASYTVSDPASRYIFGNSSVYTLRPDKYDADIKWETTATSNIGLDFGFLENRLTGSLDVYYKKTDDMISEVDPAIGTNFGSPVLTNVGSMENKGVELNLHGILLDKNDWNWELGYNLFYNKNKITKLNLNDDANYRIDVGGVGGTTSGTIQAQRVGYPLFAYYTYQQIYRADGTPIEGAFVDRNDDGVINTEDKYTFKKPAANMLMGINSWLSYRNWDLTFVGRVSLGNYVYNNVAANSTYNALQSSMGFLRNMSTQADKTKFETATETRFSDFYIENASFFRMDNINLAYTIDGVFGDKAKLKISTGVQNAFVLTKYSGLDPEISGGLDNNFFPRSRVFILGVNCEF